MNTPLEAVIERCYRELEEVRPNTEYQEGLWDFAREILRTLNLPESREGTAE